MFRKSIIALAFSSLLASAAMTVPARNTEYASSPYERTVTEVNDDLAIIVNTANPVDNLSLAQLRGIFLAERAHWPNGQKITVVMREQGQAERALVLKAVCRMSEVDFNQYLLHSAFTGQIQGGPKLLSSVAGVRKFVFNVPGAIGYVRGSEIDSSVKAVRVEGRLPGEPGYKLKLERR